MNHKGHFLATRAGLVTGALLCCTLWASAISATRLGFGVLGIASTDPPSQLVFAGMRFVLAGVAVCVWWGLRHRELPRLRTGEFWDAFKISLVWTVGQYLCYYLGMAQATGVSASLIQGLQVFVALVVSAGVFHIERLTARKVAGSLVGVLGLLVFNWGGQAGFSLAGEGLLALATVFSAVASVMVADYGERWDPVLLAGVQFALGGAVLWVVGAALGGAVRLDTPLGAGVLLWLVMVSAVAYSLWSLLLTLHPVSSVVAFTFTQPFLGVAIALAVLGDEGTAFGLAGAAGLALVCAGILLVTGLGNQRASG